ncbi:DUF4440 domain-containing protein [Pseudobacteroides cellulosolvens]|uniref:DUF4440 domain-containing protein n=1 Tax=Pseudobacteroides cellulosolvens ATCC 35603 = DSM 2933 TaxID=398512 RepID=A0A0L6JJ46_9FIRM|nr:DUF4440 domain-containing protein [Pseudobacteroides cellulosolvens]KNY25472.1 hypothetical protein Bccel_0732 [Pseudobacteroides cellulosolvens ATCC 35603 = DSM 2933]
MKLLERHIFELEKELLKPETRQSAEKISELLSDDFMEFRSSGSIYHYSMGDVFSKEIDISVENCEVRDFTIKELSNGCVLATYKVIKHSELSQDVKYSLRSSIWKVFNGSWKIVFHQGTLTSKIQ